MGAGKEKGREGKKRGGEREKERESHDSYTSLPLPRLKIGNRDSWSEADIP